VNLGGEPERDDSGLPPVDIEIPDDARELDRDVQAYRREQRALRRRQRRMRLHRPLTRDGVVLPLLASCLVLALIAGTLLTVFASGPQGELRGASPTPSHSATSTPTGSASAAPTTPPTIAEPPDTLTAQSGAALPAAAVQIDGGAVQLQKVAPAVVALLPAACSCSAAVTRLIQQSLAASLKVYVFGPASQLAIVRQLTQNDPTDQVITGQDPSGALAKAYLHGKPTALLINPNGSVGVAQLPASAFRLTHQLARLAATADPAAEPASATPTASSATTPASATSTAPVSPSPSATVTATTSASTAAASPQPA
jgi:hypothetical protein